LASALFAFRTPPRKTGSNGKQAVFSPSFPGIGNSAADAQFLTWNIPRDVS
jgi:hypothetical protein